MSLSYFLPVYLLAYVIVAFIWRSYAVRKRTGLNPFVFKGSDSAHDFIGRVTKALFGLVVAVVVIHAFMPSAYQYVMPLPMARTPVGEMDRRGPVACLSCLDGRGPGSAWGFVAHRHRLRTQDQVNSRRCLQAFSKPDLYWHDCHATGVVSRDS